MQKLSNEIEDLSIKDGEEGSVLYFSNDNHCLGLCKIKTLEYKILRKLREKCKVLSESLGSSDQFFTDFCKYIKRNEVKRRKNLEKYVEIASKAFKEISADKSKVLSIQNNFATFIADEGLREVYITIGIPGIGKKNLISSLKSIINDLIIISSDDIRKDLISELKIKNPKLPQNQLFPQTSKKYKLVFDQIVKETRGKVYIDKNIPPNAVKNLMTLINEFPSKVVAFIPKTTQEFVDGLSWPISFKVLYTCICRVLTRKDHQTLNQTDAENISLLIKMYNFYRGYDFKYYVRLGVKKLIPINFIDENTEIPEQCKQKLIEILKETKPGKDPKASSVEELLALIPEKNLSFPNIIIPFINEEIPTYIGIEFSESFNLSVVSLVTSALSSLSTIYDDHLIAEDILLFQTHDVPFSPGKLVSGNWKYPQSLHVTTLFIGKNSKVLHSPYYKSFVDKEKYSMRLNKIVYIPQKLICATVDFLNTSPLIANKIPHVTLLLGKLPAKTSNEILESISLDKDFGKYETKYGSCYTIKLSSICTEGISKMFY